MCACSGEAAARRGYDAVKLAAAYDIPGHENMACWGAWQIQQFKNPKGQHSCFFIQSAALCKIKIRYHEAGPTFCFVDPALFM